MTAVLRGILLCLWIAILCGEPVQAHELRPGFLEITQSQSERYLIRFKVPARGDLRMKLQPRFPDRCTNLGKSLTEKAGNAFFDRWEIECPGGLDGTSIRIDGLAGTFTDVIVRVGWSDGAMQAARLTPDQPHFLVRGNAGWADTLSAYFFLGTQHILEGVDHLLFVLALLLLVSNRWMLVKTVTAFTIAHSITLAAVTLSWVRVPSLPVEALIALSIAVAAAEIIRRPGNTATLLQQAPWIAAFTFGLLHGFGFGGALLEIGLPKSDVPLALLAFNVGVEAGQLLFVAVVLAVQWAVSYFRTVPGRAVRTAAAYGIGSVAIFWFIERLSRITS